MTTEPEPALRVNTETPIDPALPICDPHHHFWNSPNNRYMPEDLLVDAGSGHNITSTVFMQFSCGYRKEGPKEMRPVGETEFVRSLATPGGQGRTAIAAGIIGFADFTLGKAVEAVLEAHIEAGKGNFRGIRMAAVWDPYPEILSYKDWRLMPDRSHVARNAHPEIPAFKSTSQPKGLMLDAKFREGFAILKRFGLVYDSWIHFHQMPEMADLAQAFPDITIVLNHIGGPVLVGPYADKREEVWAEWRRGITALAACPNVVVKLGGLGMPRCGFGWDTRTNPPDSDEVAKVTSPYYLFCIERFGVRRCMFESNFPVDKVSYSYNVLWNAFKRMTSGFSKDERAALFHDTAIRVYKLKP